jgi:hypothetical protein
MTVTVVTYRTQHDRADENQALVEAVFAELAETAPAGLHYDTYRLDDGVSFVHVATVEGDTNPLQTVPAFQAFLAGIADRCEKGPLASNATRVGHYEPGDH